MKTSEEIWQLASILGKSDFFGCLSLSEGEDLPSLNPEQLVCVHDLASANTNKITRTLVHEAAARDEVKTAAQAQAYLERRLAFFGDLLPPSVKEQVREGFRTLTAQWGEDA